MRSLYSQTGDRKYLNYAERQAFYEAAMQLGEPKYRLFCLMLLHTGCRISEGLDFKRPQIDRGGRALVFFTLKQRGEIIYRPVLAPMKLIDEMLELPATKDGRLFNFCRTTGYEKVKDCMEAANIEGVKATPRGLRHGYGIGCVSIKQYPSKIQQLLGHKRPETTSIYTTYTNDDVRNQFRNIWFMEDD